MLILGTSITCSATTGKSASKKCMTSGSCSTICGAGSSRIGNEGNASTICCTVRRRTRSCGPDRVAILSSRFPPGSSSRLKSSGWGVGEDPGSSPCSSTRAPTPRPWHSSVLVRNGAFSLPGPLRRSSAHVSAMSGAVAVAASSRHCRMQTAARWPSSLERIRKQGLSWVKQLCCCYC